MHILTAGYCSFKEKKGEAYMETSPRSSDNLWYKNREERLHMYAFACIYKLQEILEHSYIRQDNRDPMASGQVKQGGGRHHQTVQ